MSHQDSNLAHRLIERQQIPPRADEVSNVRILYTFISDKVEHISVYRLLCQYTHDD